jgi:hypothetical protein
MSDERTWLQHAHGGYFHCPAEAVDEWVAMGWQVADEPPPEDNPVVVELLAAQRAAAAAREQAQQEDAEEPATPDQETEE